MDDRKQPERTAVTLGAGERAQLYSRVGVSLYKHARSPRQGVSVAQHLGDQERQLQRLLGVQPRVTGGLIAAGQVGVRNILCATQTLGDVLARDLDVDATRVSPQRAMHLEKPLH